MITPWEESYKRTKAIKTGAASLEPPFSSLVEWLNEFYDGIGALNAWVETGDKRVMAGKSALRVAFERDAAVERLSVARFSYNPSEQDRIVAHFRGLVARARMRQYDTRNMFATFHAFEHLARWEANNTVSEDDLLHLKIALDDLDVWEIHRQGDGVTFFFLTDAQLADSETSGARGVCEKSYANVLRRYDEFGYYVERPIEAAFYSKQSFNRVYHGNWFFFDR